MIARSFSLLMLGVTLLCFTTANPANSAPEAGTWHGIPVPPAQDAGMIFKYHLQVHESGVITEQLPNPAIGNPLLGLSLSIDNPGIPEYIGNLRLDVLILPSAYGISEQIIPAAWEITDWVIATDSKEGMIRIPAVPISEVVPALRGLQSSSSENQASELDPERLWELFSSPLPLILAGSYPDGKRARISITPEEKALVADALRYWAALETFTVDPPIYSEMPVEEDAGYSRYGESISGDSEDVIAINLKAGVVIFEINYCSQRNGRDTNFIASLKAANGDGVDLLANEIGCGDAKKLVQIPRTGTYYVSVDSAEGPWQMTW